MNREPKIKNNFVLAALAFLVGGVASGSSELILLLLGLPSYLLYFGGMLATIAALAALLVWNGTITIK